jgi:hypothetical protein
MKRYLARLPRSIEAGSILVHNHVRPRRKLGASGFRTWLQSPDDAPATECCPCGWAGELGAHYRVIRPAA